MPPRAAAGTRTRCADLAARSCRTGLVAPDGGGRAGNGAGFAALGLARGERVALMLPTRAEHILADLGAMHAGGTPVTLYATLAADQIAYVAGDCDARIAVLDGTAELARWQQILNRLPGL